MSAVLRRRIWIKLKPEFASGLELNQVLRSAEKSLRAAYGVQGVRVERAADDQTRSVWDVGVMLDYVSGVDEEKSARDPIRRAFEEQFLKSRAEKVWSGVFWLE